MSSPAAVPESILRHRSFALYWGARTCASMGYQMLGVAVAWHQGAFPALRRVDGFAARKP